MDNAPEFIEEFLSKKDEISELLSLLDRGTILSDYKYNSTSWTLTNAIDYILFKNIQKKRDLINSDNAEFFLTKVKKWLMKNYLITFRQISKNSDDDEDIEYWFSMIGYHGYAIIVECINERVVFYNPESIDDAVMIDLKFTITENKINSSFNRLIGKHKIDVMSVKYRKPMNKQSIEEYLQLREKLGV